MSVPFAVVWLVFLSVLCWLLISPGINRQSRDPDYPRERRVYMLMKTLEEIGGSTPRDMFGLKASKDFLPPAHHEASSVVVLSELMAKQAAAPRVEQEQRTVIGA